MREFTVMFHSVNEIAQFATIANRQPFAVHFHYKDSRLDAKSILSLCALPLQTPVTVELPDSPPLGETVHQSVAPADTPHSQLAVTLTVSSVASYEAASSSLSVESSGTTSGSLDEAPPQDEDERAAAAESDSNPNAKYCNKRFIQK